MMLAQVSSGFIFSTLNAVIYTVCFLVPGFLIDLTLFGTNSLASSEPSEHDLYLEEVYQFDENNPWQSVPATSGIWIAGDEIRYIEFWKYQEEEP